MDLGLKGLKTLVTGASRGIGRAIAELFAAEGADVAVCARGQEGLKEAEASLESHGGQVFARAIDVADGEALRAFVAAAVARLGGLDILVSNTSGMGGDGEDAWRAGFEVDVLGAVRSVEAATQALSESAQGSVVFISSTAAVETFMGPTAYNAMKGALVVHSNGLSQALAAQGIRVNTISPGPILFKDGSWDQVRQGMPEMFESTVAQIPLGRMGSAEEVARAVAFVASPAASFITGTNLIVDGGFTKRVDF